MMKRISVTAFLTVIIAVMAAAVVAVLFSSAWDSFDRLRSAEQLTLVARASAGSFKTMSNLRTARAIMSNSLEADAPIDPELELYLAKVRSNYRAALSSLLETMPAVRLADSASTTGALRAQTDTFVGLDDASFAAIKTKKSERQGD